MGGPAPSVQFSWDGPGALGAGDDGKALCWDQSSGRFVLTAKAAAGHTHAPSDLTQGGATSGQVLIWDGAEWAPATLPEGVTDHGDLDGLGDDDHPQYVLLAPASSTRNVIQPTGAAIKALVIKGATSQSANLLELQNSAGTVVAGVAPAGTVYGPSGNAGGTMAFAPVPSASITAGIYFAAGSGGWGILGRSDGAAWVEWGSGIGGLGLRMTRGFYVTSVSSSNNAIQVHGSTNQSVTTVYIRAASGQTGDLQQWQSSASAVLFAVGPAGQIKTAQTTANTNTPSGATARQLPLYNESGTLLGYVPVYGSAW